MTRLEIAFAGLLAPLLVMLLGAAKPAADPSELAFDFDAAAVRLRTKAMDTPKAVDASVEALALELGDDTFSLALDDGALLTGHWTRKSPKSRKLTLALDADGEAALLASIGQRVADQLLPPWAQTGPAELALLELKAFVRLHEDKQTGALTAKLVLRARVGGGVQPAGPDGVPLKSSVKIVALSVPVQLD